VSARKLTDDTRESAERVIKRSGINHTLGRGRVATDHAEVRVGIANIDAKKRHS
jgi:hypothetical protein